MALSGIPANRTYSRRARDREQDLAGPGGVLADPAVFRRVVGSGVNLEEVFMAGDLIEIVPGGGLPPERRVVLEVLRPAPGQPAVLRVDAPFTRALALAPAAPPLPTGVPYRRIGRLSQQGFDFTPSDPTALFGGSSVIDRAADLATLLSLGVTSHLLTDADAAAVGGSAEGAHPAVGPADRVFRDWNLNHRRVNEWRMLVQGQAFAEPQSQTTADLVGWAPLLSRWLDMAHRPAVDSHAEARFRPQDPTNRSLSTALAELLGLPLPA